MIDVKKIEEAEDSIYNDKFLRSGRTMYIDEDNDIKEVMFEEDEVKYAIELGAKWAINEFLKDLLHPASEVPRNDNGKVLAFSREFGFRKLYDMNAMLDETTCRTYQEMWKKEVKAFHWSDWIFIEDLINLIKKGGE